MDFARLEIEFLLDPVQFQNELIPSDCGLFTKKMIGSKYRKVT